MKIVVNIECTPEEARQFLGLPDVQPLQERMMKEIEARMEQGLAAMDPETALKTWLPASIQGLEQLQRMFWNAAANAVTQPKGK
jgi:tetrahydromethanopterin S-methyltransferase subunit B